MPSLVRAVIAPGQAENAYRRQELRARSVAICKQKALACAVATLFCMRLTAACRSLPCQRRDTKRSAEASCWPLAVHCRHAQRPLTAVIVFHWKTERACRAHAINTCWLISSSSIFAILQAAAFRLTDAQDLTCHPYNIFFARILLLCRSLCIIRRSTTLCCT